MTIHDTYRSACQALNLLENDQHWDNCTIDACEMSTPSQIPALFGIILTTYSPSSPTELWEKYKSQMAEDILNRIRLERSDMTLAFTKEIYNCTLVMIEDLCLPMANKLLKHLGMPSPNLTAAISTCVLSYIQTNTSKLTSEQKGIYDQIMHCVDNEVGEIFFMDEPGGTGKTFLIRLLLASIQSKNDSVGPCVVQNSRNVAALWENCQFRFEIASEYAIYRNSHVQHFQIIWDG